MDTDYLVELVNEVITGLGEANITPAEGMTVAELALWTLMENAMKFAKTVELQQAAKLTAMRVAARLASRVEAWPAKPSERN